MKFEFNQGVPKDCIEWLWENVGKGNRDKKMQNFVVISEEDSPEYDWFYKRMTYEIPSKNPMYDSGTRHVPTIFVKDEKKAILFALRWL